MAAAKRKPRSTGLTAERIREAALVLIDAEGLDAFSTRRLGAALGCEAMAIYWYYPSKEALLDAVVDELVQRIGGGDYANARPDDDWIDALRKLAHAYRRLAHKHPNAFPLLATRRFATEGTWRFLEGLFDLARREGLDDRTAARFFRLVSSYCSGVALDELAGVRQADRKSPRPAPADFPRLASASAWLQPEHYDDVFSFGLEVLLEALARAPKKKR
ncbi:MAG TPA: TetR/AcrR family transcriptional regulator [Labilithrix sp.]|jgi:AcrR family transcriptional regulator